jgi:transcriptional regulator with XRE-family HTH domain
MNKSRISALRKAKGWTQERLADVSGVAVRTIQRLESGQDANLETLRLIADALGVDVSELFTNVENEETKMVIDTFDAEKALQARQRETERKAYKRGLGLGFVFVMMLLFYGFYALSFQGLSFI